MILDVKLWSDGVCFPTVSGKYHPLKSLYFYAELVLLNPVVVSTKKHSKLSKCCNMFTSQEKRHLESRVT